MNTENKSQGLKMGDIKGLADLLANVFGNSNVIHLRWKKSGSCWDVALEDMNAHVHPAGLAVTGWDALVNNEKVGTYGSEQEAINAASKELIYQFENKKSIKEAESEANESGVSEYIERQVSDILTKMADPDLIDKGTTVDMLSVQAETIATQKESLKNQEAVIKEYKQAIDRLVQQNHIKDSAITRLISAHMMVLPAETKAMAIERAIKNGKLAQSLSTGESELNEFTMVASDLDVMTFLKSYDPDGTLIAREPGSFSRIKTALQGVCNTVNRGRNFRLVPKTQSTKELVNAG